MCFQHNGYLLGIYPLLSRRHIRRPNLLGESSRFQSVSVRMRFCSDFRWFCGGEFGQTWRVYNITRVINFPENTCFCASVLCTVETIQYVNLNGRIHSRVNHLGDSRTIQSGVYGRIPVGNNSTSRYTISYVKLSTCTPLDWPRDVSVTCLFQSPWVDNFGYVVGSSFVYWLFLGLMCWTVGLSVLACTLVRSVLFCIVQFQFTFLSFIPHIIGMTIALFGTRSTKQKWMYQW